MLEPVHRCETGLVEPSDLLTPGAADASVRPAVAADAGAVAAVQARAWRRAYAAVMPAEAAGRLTADLLLERWTAAVTHPPSDHHHVLVASAGTLVVGFAAVAPSGDPDAGPADAELVALEVDPSQQRHGHASRLLSAVVSTIAPDGFEVLRIWCLTQDEPRRRFLTSAGLRPDGAGRQMRGDGGRRIREERWSAALPT